LKDEDLNYMKTDSVAALCEFVEKWDELKRHRDNGYAWTQFEIERDTADELAMERWNRLLNSICPLLDRAEDGLSQKFLSSTSLNDLDSSFSVMIPRTKNSANIFAEENEVAN
jgi:hypothetical protein